MQNLLGNKSDYEMDAVNIDELVDIQDVVIDTSLSTEERMQSYLEQIKNPHCYKCDDMIVRVSFANTDVTLEDRMKQYLLSGSQTAII